MSPISLVANGDLLLRLMFVVVSLPSHDRGLVEVVGGWGRGRHPLQPHRVPRIGTSLLTVSQRPHKIDHRQDVAYGQDRSTCRGEHVQHLELRRISMIAA